MLTFIAPHLFIIMNTQKKICLWQINQVQISKQGWLRSVLRLLVVNMCFLNIGPIGLLLLEIQNILFTLSPRGFHPWSLGAVVKLLITNSTGNMWFFITVLPHSGCLVCLLHSGLPSMGKSPT